MFTSNRNDVDYFMFTLSEEAYGQPVMSNVKQPNLCLRTLPLRQHRFLIFWVDYCFHGFANPAPFHKDRLPTDRSGRRLHSLRPVIVNFTQSFPAISFAGQPVSEDMSSVTYRIQRHRPKSGETWLAIISKPFVVQWLFPFE